MTCRAGEEDKLAWEGLGKRRIMGLRRESSYFLAAGRYVVERLPRRDGREVEVLKEA